MTANPRLRQGEESKDSQLGWQGAAHFGTPRDDIGGGGKLRQR
jgi:hypothetical protein